MGSHSAVVRGRRRMKGASEGEPSIKLKEMDEKNMHNLFLKNMAGLIEETKNPSPCSNPNSKRGGMATHAGVALELGITRAQASNKSKICNFTTSWSDGLAFCALIHHFFPQAFDFTKLSKENRKQNFELAFHTGERLAGIPDFISGDDMDEMISSGRLDPKVVFAYVQEVYRALKDN